MLGSSDWTECSIFVDRTARWMSVRLTLLQHVAETSFSRRKLRLLMGGACLEGKIGYEKHRLVIWTRWVSKKRRGFYESPVLYVGESTAYPNNFGQIDNNQFQLKQVIFSNHVVNVDVIDEAGWCYLQVWQVDQKILTPGKTHEIRQTINIDQNLYQLYSNAVSELQIIRSCDETGFKLVKNAISISNSQDGMNCYDK